MASSVITLEVEVLDGDCIEVPFLEVGARFSYATIASTWSTASADCGGRARFRDEHAEPPVDVTFFVKDENCGTFPVEDGACYVLET
ncbi:MAG: hypothetical protein QNJ77_11565 [Acidimicrobiia bacterium]|nr:hypothetical protein [Acidimicrobiia bacterium]